MFPARDGLQAGLAQRQPFADDIRGVLEVRCLCRMLQAPLLCVDVLLILPAASPSILFLLSRPAGFFPARATPVDRRAAVRPFGLT
jgi:hypothetical protein